MESNFEPIFCVNISKIDAARVTAIIRVTAIALTKGRRFAFFAFLFPVMYRKKNAKNAKRRGRAVPRRSLLDVVISN